MLKINKLVDYAVLIMGQLAQGPCVLLSAPKLAHRLHLSVPTVSKVLKALAEAGLVSAVRGAEGGYQLARPASEISVVDVLVAMEGELALTVCCEKKGQCAIGSTCMMRENWQKINQMLRSWLSTMTLLDMSRPLSNKQWGAS